MIRITKEFRFEGAHALSGYNGKCKHIHGHSYLLYVTIRGEALKDKSSSQDGMLMDFNELKQIVNSRIIDVYDHSLMMCQGSALQEEIIREYGNVVVLPFRPTCENLISHFANIIIQALPSGVELYSLKLYETATSFVEWFAEDNASR